MPHLSQSTISLGVSESSFLHLMQIMSVVVSSTVTHTHTHTHIYTHTHSIITAVISRNRNNSWHNYWLGNGTQLGKCVPGGSTVVEGRKLAITLFCITRNHSSQRKGVHNPQPLVRGKILTFHCAITQQLAIRLCGSFVSIGDVYILFNGVSTLLLLHMITGPSFESDTVSYLTINTCQGLSYILTHCTNLNKRTMSLLGVCGYSCIIHL